MSVTRKFEALLARDLTLKECAQRAFKAYLKSVFLMKNKDVFDVTQLDLPSFARLIFIGHLDGKFKVKIFHNVFFSLFFSSLGLAVAPRVRFLQKRGVCRSENSLNQNDSSQDDESEEDMDTRVKVAEPKAPTTFDFNSGV